jgi:hypothetical protein
MGVCTLKEPTTHDMLSQNLNLPRNLDYGGFYCSNEYPFYAVYKHDHFIYLRGDDFEEIPVSQVFNSRKVITYLDASLNWIVLKDLFRELGAANLNRVHIAYNSDSDSGTEGGQTFPLGSSLNRNLDFSVDLQLMKDGSVLDKGTNDLFPPNDYYHQLMPNILLGPTSGRYAILISGSEDVSAGEIISVINTLSAFIPRSDYCEGVLISTK